MIKLPSMRYSSKIKSSTQVKFAGLDHTAGAKEGTLYDMVNMCADDYPVLSTRKKRGNYQALETPGGIGAYEKLYWVDGTKFFYDGEEKGTVSLGQKRFVPFAGKVIILPDKLYYDTYTGEFASLEARWTGESLTFSDGESHGVAAKRNRIHCDGANWAAIFSVGDGVQLTGCTVHPENNQTFIIREIHGDDLYVKEDALTLSGEESDEAYTENGEMKVQRTMPDLEFACVNENRMWGCAGDMIYASMLGDPKNWMVYDGAADNAWFTPTGTAGSFTGCISYRGYPVFFKEHHIFKVYGSVPSNFQVLSSASMGLAVGAADSLAIANETLYYLTENGPAAYTGGIPQIISRVFGNLRFTKAVAGSDGLKYYASMCDSTGRWRLYVYDTQSGLWHIEDDIQVLSFARYEGKLYMLLADGQIVTTEDTDTDEGSGEVIPWMCEFGDFIEGSPYQKGVTKLLIRLELEKNARARVWMQYDSGPDWVKVGDLRSEGYKRSYYLPVPHRRCDHFRLKLEGVGGVKIHSITREYSVGSGKQGRKGKY